MSIQTDNREATATIRGYLYQFDATVLAILGLKNNDILTIEGIEDFDVECGDLSNLFQCKYYAAQRLTPATIRDAILPMLKGFISVDKPSHSELRYHLYGYFKDTQPGEKRLNSVELKKSLIRRERITPPSGEARTEVIDIQEEIGASDEDIERFVQRLTIHTCTEYDEHKKDVVHALQTEFRVSRDEAEQYLYPTAFTLVSGLAANPDRKARQISRKLFFQQVQPSRALYNAWTLREKGEVAYCSSIRRKYFSDQNIDAVHRFFVIETLPETTDADLLFLLRTLQRKWSSHRTRRKPNAERYAPYIYFNSLPPERLVALKQILHKDGTIFVDGYPFLGAEFSVNHLSTPQTYENQISLRLVSSEDDLRQSLEGVHGMRSIYEFFVNTRIGAFPSAQQVVIIPVTSMSMVTQIV